jgi:hypothetical protein
MQANILFSPFSITHELERYFDEGGWRDDDVLKVSRFWFLASVCFIYAPPTRILLTGMCTVEEKHQISMCSCCKWLAITPCYGAALFSFNKVLVWLLTQFDDVANRSLIFVKVSMRDIKAMEFHALGEGCTMIRKPVPTAWEILMNSRLSAVRDNLLVTQREEKWTSHN